MKGKVVMREKKKFLIVITIFVIIGMGGLIFFVLSNNDNVKTVDLVGTWKVASSFSNENPTLYENEYMQFTNDSVIVNKDGLNTLNSKYVIEKNAYLKIVETSKEYMIERITDNYLRLCEGDSKYIDLIRYPNEDFSDTSVSVSELYDKWNVVYRNTEKPIADESLVFTEKEIKDFRGGAMEPVAVSEYEWVNKDCLLAKKWGIEYKLIQLSEDTIFFIETKSGFVWELKRAS